MTSQSKASVPIEDQPAKSIDLNCDMGESYGDRIVGDDQQIMPLVTSANIACGFHGGDRATMEQAVALAIEHGVQIGAHPSSHRDLEGFGRQPFPFCPETLAENLKEQIETLANVVIRKGGQLSYVKPHGFLYHAIQNRPEVATVFVQTVASLDNSLKILAADNEHLHSLCSVNKTKLIHEGFADRRYQPTGQLVPRSEDDAVIETPHEAASQAINLAVHGRVIASDQTQIRVSCQSICVHGDSKNSVETLLAIRQAASEYGVELIPF